MKKIICVMIVLAITLGCVEQSKKQIKTTKITPADQTRLVLAAQTVIKNYSNDLKSALMSAVKKSGAASAINVCSRSAPEIDSKFSSEHFKIYRVTDRPRNPENAADEHQLKVLSAFSDTVAALPDSHVWATDSGQKVFTYYKPIRTNSLCLKCHGGRSTMEKEVSAALDEKYPDDKATDYSAGQLRGMFVVEMNWPQVKEYLDEINGK